MQSEKASDSVVFVRAASARSFDGCEMVNTAVKNTRSDSPHDSVLQSDSPPTQTAVHKVD